jgi:hypothetical protein
MTSSSKLLDILLYFTFMHFHKIFIEENVGKCSFLKNVQIIFKKSNEI